MGLFDQDPDERSTGAKEPGFAAVSSKFGAKWVERIRLLPHWSRRFWAQYYLPDNPDLLELEVEIARKAVRRAGQDKDFAIRLVHGLLERDASEAELEALRQKWYPGVDPWDLNAIQASIERQREEARQARRPTRWRVAEELGIPVDQVGDDEIALYEEIRAA
jgi:hypothetical protein